MVSNTGNIKITNLTFNDTMVDGKGVALSLSNSPTLVSASLGSTTGTLELSEVVTYTANYVLTHKQLTVV